ncbi:MAG: hypothetical protein ACRCVJ_18385 [Clostridium sp.]|uniref:hypothetical protein n=1 Tax=Clostridium sp. TaxID=1506 RepID=UPI003F3721B9
MILDRLKKKKGIIEEEEIKVGDHIKCIQDYGFIKGVIICYGEVIKIYKDGCCIQKQTGNGAFISNENIIKKYPKEKGEVKFIFECEKCKNLMQSEEVEFIPAFGKMVSGCTRCGESKYIRALEVSEY